MLFACHWAICCQVDVIVPVFNRKDKIVADDGKSGQMEVDTVESMSMVAVVWAIVGGQAAQSSSAIAGKILIERAPVANLDQLRNQHRRFDPDFHSWTKVVPQVKASTANQTLSPHQAGLAPGHHGPSLCLELSVYWFSVRGVAPLQWTLVLWITGTGICLVADHPQARARDGAPSFRLDSRTAAKLGENSMAPGSEPELLHASPQPIRRLSVQNKNARGCHAAGGGIS